MMVNTILLILSNGFDDFAFITNQVLLEENNVDLIIASQENGTVKGIDSSVLAVSLNEAISHNIDYQGLVVIGGKDLINWDELKKVLTTFKEGGKIIGCINEGVDLCKEFTSSFSVDEKIIVDSNIITLFDPEYSEKFVEEFLNLINLT